MSTQKISRVVYYAALLHYRTVVKSFAIIFIILIDNNLRYNGKYSVGKI